MIRMTGWFRRTALTAGAVLGLVAISAPVAAAAFVPSPDPLPIWKSYKLEQITCVSSIGPKDGVDVKENGKIVVRGKTGCNVARPDRSDLRVFGQLRLQKKKPNGNWDAIATTDVGDNNVLAKAMKPCAAGTYRGLLTYEGYKHVGRKFVVIVPKWKLFTPELTVTRC
jgi:hypothetical protein